MTSRCAIGMVLLDRGIHADKARAALVAALPEATASEPDDLGVFEVTFEDGSRTQEAALEQVWDAVASAGADDHIAFLEHPALPEHWRHKAQAPA
jgi:hypothetical protein